MNIYYDDDGTILDVSDIQVERPEAHISVPDNKMPDDLVATFALGKYRVRNGKLSPNRSFTGPDDHLITSLLPEGLFQVAAPERVESPQKNKRRSGKPRKD